MTELSDKAKEVCKEHYTKKCGVCPIRKQCVVSVGSGYESHNRWLQGVNEAAEKVV
ncbi:MAG TPA: hypothetical protein VE710_18255 [Candidatus Bathyarchaeia archaeon]|nr:hypothetical protein [Candidatus Bathyarchaeia archaeon]